MEEAGAATPSLSDIPDTRTAYEKKWDEQVPIPVFARAAAGVLLPHVLGCSRVGVFVACTCQVKKLDVKRAKEQAKKTHRDRIEDFNHQLSLVLSPCARPLAIRPLAPACARAHPRERERERERER